MVKWDSLGRDALGALSREVSDLDGLYRIHKGPEILSLVLNKTSAQVDLLTLATWNDLGEGTAINRQLDYYYQGQWLPPNFFMNIVRQAQCQSTTPQSSSIRRNARQRVMERS